MTSTIKDVAAAAGVSIKTVSNVVNGYQHVSAHTRQAVQDAITRLDYRPNAAARNLRNGRTGLVAVAVPTLANPYYAELAQVLVSTAEKAGLTVLVDCTGGDAERELRAVEGFDTHLVDGLIMIPHALRPAQLRSRRADTPLVILGERVSDAADSIGLDSRAAARAATEHLIGLGRRRIAHLGVQPVRGGPVQAAHRLAGYRDALTAAGLPDDASLVALVDEANTVSSTDGALAALLNRTPRIDALFCFNDLLALKALQALAAAGRRVPADVAVIGLDDITAARLCTPSLSSVAPDTQEIAERAVERLRARMGGDTGPGRRIVTGFQVRARGSSAL